MSFECCVCDYDSDSEEDEESEGFRDMIINGIIFSGICKLCFRKWKCRPEHPDHWNHFCVAIYQDTVLGAYLPDALVSLVWDYSKNVRIPKMYITGKNIEELESQLGSMIMETSCRVNWVVINHNDNWQISEQNKSLDIETLFWKERYLIKSGAYPSLDVRNKNAIEMVSKKRKTGKLSISLTNSKWKKSWPKSYSSCHGWIRPSELRKNIMRHYFTYSKTLVKRHGKEMCAMSRNFITAENVKGQTFQEAAAAKILKNDIFPMIESLSDILAMNQKNVIESFSPAQDGQEFAQQFSKKRKLLQVENLQRSKRQKL